MLERLGVTDADAWQIIETAKVPNTGNDPTHFIPAYDLMYYGKEAIEWLVLETQDDKILIISKYGLDWQRYDKNTVENGITWEFCTLRKWLNGRFINAAFNEREKQLISTVTVPADRNPEYDTNLGNPMEDKVFLLSINEANRYFSSDELWQCRPTEYAVANGVNQLDGGNCQWWLWSPGFEGNCAAIVSDDGGISSGHYVGSGTVAIRPILWIDLNA